LNHKVEDLRMPKQTLQHLAGHCRVDTLVGVYWLLSPETLQSWVDSAWAIVERGELKEVQLRSEEISDGQEERPYALENGIARLTMSGPMTKYKTSFSSLFGGVPMQHMREVFRGIRNNSDVRAVFVDADSPGGTAEGTAELVDAVRKTVSSGKPVHFHAEDKACSAMLWVASQGSGFTAGPAASVGSQGVIAKLVDSSAISKSTGLKPVIVATGPYKSIGAPGVEISKEHLAEVQRMVNLVNAPFKADVQKSRKLNKSQAEEVATARVFIGQDALRVGLIDRVCSADEAYEDFSRKVTVAPGSGSKATVQTSAASERRKGMLTPEQLTDVRKLPGAATVTEENADVFLLNALNTALSTNKVLTGEKTSLESQVQSLSQKIPATVDPKIAEGHVKLFGKELDMALKAGQAMPEQVALIKAAVSPAAVTADGKVMIDSETFSKVLELNKPTGLVGEKSAGQPAPRTEPGGKEKEEAVTPERRAELLASIGITPSGNGQH
jgi:signal peptide peptidase SppA